VRRQGAISVALLVASLCLLAPSSSSARLPPIKHVFIVVLENEGFDKTFGYYSPAPYLSKTLPAMGALVPSYYGVSHQSFPNYAALISGQGANPISQADCIPVYLNVTPGTVGPDGQAMGGGCVYPSAVKTVADQLAASGRSWKGYMEDMGNGPPGTPATCRHPQIGQTDNTQVARNGDQYASRHNPFVYFHSIIDQPACSQNDVPLSQLPGDLSSSSRTASYSLIVPNLCHDGHDSPCVDKQPGGLTSANAWLRTWVPQILRSPAYRSGGLLVITFDESSGSDASACCDEPQFPNTPNNGGPYPGRGGGRVGAVMLSPYIDPGTIDQVGYNHFSLLRSVEDLFGLGHLGFAAQSGLRALGSDVFTCYAPNRPRVRHHRLPRRSELKLVTIGQGTAPRPRVEIKLWHPGSVTVKVTPRGRKRKRQRTLVRGKRLGACQLLKVRLPRGHGRVLVKVRAFGGFERRTLRF
jgi:phosphatidylinositol-3-phosphatase